MHNEHEPNEPQSLPNDSVSTNPQAGQTVSPNTSTQSEPAAPNPDFSPTPPPTPVVPESKQKKSMIRTLLIVVTLLSFVVVALMYLLFLYLSTLANNGTSGTEFIALAFWPVIAAVPYLSVMGLVTGAILIFKTPGWKRYVWGAISLLLLAACVFQAVTYVQDTKRTKEYERLLGHDETVALIAGCELGAINYNMDNDGKVYLSYKNNYDKNGGWIWKPDHADGKYYADYVEAAKKAKDKCGEISYLNSTPGEKNDPSSEGHRWIMPEEAKRVLLNCEISTFNYGPISLPEKPEGTETGIAFIDYGFVKHLYVYPQYEVELLATVKEAKAKCGAGKPQLWNGSYERI